MTRWKASAIHFTISLAVIGLTAAIIVWCWYPPELFGMAKAGILLGLLGGVDLVIGPLLTLLVYKQGKKLLKFDLTVIVLLQVAALAYGLQTVWHSRPVYIASTEDRSTATPRPGGPRLLPRRCHGMGRKVWMS
jgi:hypothetical protein